MRKVWIDITNSPHVLFFSPIIKRLSKDRITVTTREHSQTIDLLKLMRIDYTVIGSHSGKSKFMKAIGLIRRTAQLYNHMKNRDCDVVIVHQSPYAIFTGWLLGIKKRVFIFDNETATLQNMIGIPFCTEAVCPEAITRERIFFRKLIKYHGLKERIYITPLKSRNHNRKKILLRPEPWTAAYYNAGNDVLAPIINNLSSKWELVLLPRDEIQKRYYTDNFHDQVRIPTKVEYGPKLISDAALVIGAGGTMNREAAVLGVPVISTYRGKTLAVDKWLIDKNYMFKAENITIKYVLDCLRKCEKGQIPSGINQILAVIA